MDDVQPWKIMCRRVCIGGSHIRVASSTDGFGAGFGRSHQDDWADHPRGVHRGVLSKHENSHSGTKLQESWFEYVLV
jgi:hypothetical protein